jgi:hypothetical protein
LVWDIDSASARVRERERSRGVEGEEGMVDRIGWAKRFGRWPLKLRCKLRYLLSSISIPLEMSVA